MCRHAQCGPLRKRKSKLILFEIETIKNGIENCDECSFPSPVLIFLATTSQKLCIVSHSQFGSVKMCGDQQIDHFSFRDRPLEKCWGGGGVGLGILRDATYFFFLHVRWKSFFKLI